MFRGTVMDWSKTPESLTPENLYAAVSFDAVNRVFRDGKVFNSQIYDNTIGLFIGPTILAMEGKIAPRTPQPGVRGVQVEVSGPVGTRDRATGRQRAHRRVHRGRQADLVRDFTFEFPTRVISKLLGLPEEDLRGSASARWS